MFRRLAQPAGWLLLAFFLEGCERNAPGPAASSPTAQNISSDQFLSLMKVGKNYLVQGDVTNALAAYRQAEARRPNDADLRLNLANCYLLAGEAAEAIREAEESLKLEPNSAAAYFVKGSAHLRLNQPEEAVKALENARKSDPGESATHFQLGVARMGLKQWEEAIAVFREGLAMDPNRLHTGPRYLLAQSLLQAGKTEEANQELQRHQLTAAGGKPEASATTFERCKYTQARVPFKLDQPEHEGIGIKFVDATAETLGSAAPNFSGPIGIIDPTHSGWNSLFVTDRNRGFQLLANTNGTFHPTGIRHPSLPGSRYAKMVVGDLQNDRFEDIIVLGDAGSHLFRFGTNGLVNEESSRSGLHSLAALDGILMDLDFTGKLDLVAVTSQHEARIFRQSAPLLFGDVTAASGIPESLRSVGSVRLEEWNQDGITDLILGRQQGPPLLLEKQRGGRLVAREPESWIAGTVFTTGDFDNDLRPDLAIVNQGTVTVCFHGGGRSVVAEVGSTDPRRLVAVDYDNDGWLDLWATGDTIRVWRNRGLAGFEEQTSRLGLDLFEGPVAEIHFADFDSDCDSDVVVALARGGLRYLRNEGGNANAQIKLNLVGNRSNASGIGCRIEIETGGLRLIRTVHSLPVEVGVGKTQTLDSYLVHWFNWPQGSVETPFDCSVPIFAQELTLQEGSCPYLYAWDGQGFRFVTDILGSAPLGLPLAEGRYIEADPEELVWFGNEETFPPRDESYQLQITEELREVLYLDEAKLVVVDHEPGTEVHSTDKLRPGKPYPPGGILTLHHEHPLVRAERLEGQDVTAALVAADGRRVSPPQLRLPHLRGLAEPHGLVLDFGPLEATKPLVLVLNGWLRFGGGMANIAAAQDPSLPFPFPTLEAEVAPGIWEVVDVVVGAPAGKTKTILVDLEDRLKAGSRRLRLKGAFEIHWDRIALMEKKRDAPTVITFLAPIEADLHYRGFSPLKSLPADWPLTPDYEMVKPNSLWTLTPGGWCTRYGEVKELIATRDEGLALINAGDELTLKFAASALPPKPAGTRRDFFLYVDGWDKDSDFHVATGTRVEPLPFHGMNDQEYGREPRPPFPSDTLHRNYNTRWVEGTVVKQTVGLGSALKK